MIKTAVKQSESDPDESVDIEKLIDDVVPDPSAWRITPNPMLGGEKPADVIGTTRETILRDMLRAAKHGMVS